MDQAGLQLLKERQDVTTLQLTADDHFALVINAVNLKYRLGNVETDLGRGAKHHHRIPLCRWQSGCTAKARRGGGSIASGRQHAGDPGAPSGRGCDVAIVSRRRTARRASAACNGLAVADLASAACCDWNDAARSSQCRRFAAPHPADRCHRRDRRSNSPAWLRSCRSRSIAAPSGLRDGSPRAC